MISQLTWVYRLIVPRHGPSRMMAWLAVISVIMGMASFIVTQSVVSGFERAYKEGILHFAPHVEVMGDINGMDQHQAPLQLASALTNQHINYRRILPYRYREGLIVSHGVVRGVALRGLSLDDWQEATHVEVKQSDGQIPSEIPNVWLGAALAGELHLKPGDEFSIMIPSTHMSETDSDIDRWMVKVVVAATFKSGLYDQDSQFVMMESDVAARLFDMSQSISAMELYLNDPEMAPDVAIHIRHQFPEWYAQPWQEANQSLFEAIAMERVMFVCVIGILLVVACCNIIAAIILCVLLRRHAISIWRAMGMNVSRITTLFMIYGSAVGALGIVGGLGLGSGIVSWLHRTHWIPLSSEVYLISYLPVSLSPVVLVACSVGALALSVVTAWIASRRVMTMSIVDGLRKAV